MVACGYGISLVNISCVQLKLYLTHSMDSIFFLQIVFIDNASKVGDLAKKLGFQREDVITLTHGRCVNLFSKMIWRIYMYNSKYFM